MDLISLSIRSLDLTETFSTKENFQSGTSEETTKRHQEESQPERLRLLTDSKDESCFLNEVPKCLKTITLDEIAWHDTADSCWLVIYDFVYDCTDFLKNHPGGSDILLEYAGRDATLAFIGTGHSKATEKILERYLIGELPLEERIFRIPGGVKIAQL